MATQPTQTVGQIHQLRIDAILFRDVLLKFNEESIWAKQIQIDFGDFFGLFSVVAGQCRRDFAAQAGTGADQALHCEAECFFIDPGFVVEAFGVSDGGEFEQVVVAGEILS